MLAADVRYGLVRTVDPAAEPVSDAEARAWLRVDHDGDDPMIQSLIRAAREHLENASGMAFVTQTWKLYLDRFPGWEIELPRSPLLAVTSIAYVDSAGVSQTLSSSLYAVDETARPGVVYPAWGEAWPATRYQPKGVTITFAAGFGAPSAVPEGVKQAVKALLAYGYANDGALPSEVPAAVYALLSPHTDGRFP